MFGKKENEELMKALRYGDMKTLRAMKPEVVRADAGKYAYACAVNAEVVYFLIECGVKPVLGNRGETPLFHCSPDKVESLIAAGYDVNQRVPDEFGELALIKETYANNMEKVLKLLAYGADVRLKNQYGRNALFFAKTPQMVHVLRMAEMRYHYLEMIEFQRNYGYCLPAPQKIIDARQSLRERTVPLLELRDFSKQNAG